jgi:hypothetical protein
MNCGAIEKPRSFFSFSFTLASTGSQPFGVSPGSSSFSVSPALLVPDDESPQPFRPRSAATDSPPPAARKPRLLRPAGDVAGTMPPEK